MKSVKQIATLAIVCVFILLACRKEEQPDMNGRKLESAFNNRNITEGQSEYQIPTQTLASGIYLVHLFVGGEHHVKRLVKN